MTLRLLTLNLWNRSGRYEARAPLIRGAIEELRPDVIGLQEVVRTESGDQATELLDGLGYEIIYAEAGAFWSDDAIGFGNAVASRWPIVSSETLKLPEGAGRVATAVLLDAPFGQLAVCCTHLNWRPDEGCARERQVVAIADLIARTAPPGGFPPVLVGDLNASPDTTEIRFLRGRHALQGRSAYLVDAWLAAGDGSPGETWSSRNPHIGHVLEPDRRIDYVFVGSPLMDGRGLVERCKVVCDEPCDDVWPSDHFGVYAEVRSTPFEDAPRGAA